MRKRCPTKGEAAGEQQNCKAFSKGTSEIEEGVVEAEDGFGVRLRTVQGRNAEELGRVPRWTLPHHIVDQGRTQSAKGWGEMDRVHSQEQSTPRSAECDSHWDLALGVSVVGIFTPSG